MSKPGPRSILYRLIIAGQAARRALAEPASALGLETGDDALILLLEQHGASAAALAELAGLSTEALAGRIERLRAHGIVAPEPGPVLLLTERGTQVARLLSSHWRAIDDDLLADLRPSERRLLRRTLKRFTARLPT